VVLGPEAAHYLAAALKRLGYQVILKSSPWRLGAEQAALQSVLINGWIGAVRQMVPALDGPLMDWSVRRRRLIALGHSRLRVGHLDLFATLDSGWN
jgi:hypothetical protein